MAAKKKTTKKTATAASVIKKARARLIDRIDDILDDIAKEREEQNKEVQKLLDSKVLTKKNTFTGKAKEVWEAGRDARVKALKAILKGKAVTAEMVEACEVGCPRSAYDHLEGTFDHHLDEGSVEGEKWWFRTMDAIYNAGSEGLEERLNEIEITDNVGW